MRVFSPDDSEFAEVRYRLPNRQVAARDFLYDIVRAYGMWNGKKDGSWPEFDFREVFAGRGVKTSIRRMIRETQAEFSGTEITAPGRPPVAENYAYVIYKRNTDAPTPRSRCPFPAASEKTSCPGTQAQLRDAS